MSTLLTVGDSEGSRRCDAKCDEATEADCDCCCGGRYHGRGIDAARALIHADVLAGRFGAGAAGVAAQLTAEALQDPLF